MKALVLSGGGAKGSYEIGVWKALRKLNIKFDIVTGTSVGALNGAIITQNSYLKALNIWKKINFGMLFEEESIEYKNNLELYKIYGRNFLKNGGMNTDKIEALVNRVIKKDKFYRSKINFGLVTYDYRTKKPLELEKKEIPKELLSDYLIASASCYPAFKKKEINGKEYIDGGYYDNLPINLALKMGATEIIAIDLRAPGIKKLTKERVNIDIIRPNNKLSNFLEFSEKSAKRNLILGYNDTLKYFHKLEGGKYSFKLGHIEKNKKRIKGQFKYLLEEILNTKKLVTEVEKIVTKDNNRENELLLKLMEELASELKLEDTKIYSYRKFNHLLKKNLKNSFNLKEIDLYKLLNRKDYKSIRKEMFINPIRVLKAIYLYIICEG